MFNFLSRFFRVKQREVEAKLLPTPQCAFGGVGEVEIETWSNGFVQLEASLKHTGLPDGANVLLFCGGRQILTLQVTDGYAKRYLSAENGQEIPDMRVGDQAELRYQNQILYTGQFRPD